MAQYTIDFSTNANVVLREVEKVNRAIAEVSRTGKGVTIDVDVSSLTRGINASFRQLNREIDKMQSRLSKLQIGSGQFRKTAASIGFREGQLEAGRSIAEPLRLRGQAQAFDEGTLQRLQRELQALKIEASNVRPATAEWNDLQTKIAQINNQLRQTDRLAESIQLTEDLGAFSPGSLNALEARLTILRNRAREISPDTREWKNLNREIVNVEQSIERQTSQPLSRGQRLGAAGGAFLYGGGVGGGIGSALGGIVGGLAGGVPGAFTGAALGQLTDSIGRSIGAMSEQASGIQRMQRGLAQASIDARDFAQAQQAVFESSQKLLMPLEQTMKYYTQLRVNTKQFGLSVQDTQKMFEGTALAVMATGGSLEDLDGAMRAVVQVMSKGKLSAEELRGQLGERLPGAVVKFAAANNLSLQELDKLLEEGKLGVGEFVKFLKGAETEYAGFSKQLQTAPEYAGMRLQKSFENIRLALGDVFAPAGASLQDTLARMLNGMANFVNEHKAFIKQMIQDWKTIISPIAKVFGDILKLGWNMTRTLLGWFQDIFRQVRKSFGMLGLGELRAELARVNKKIEEAGGEEALRQRSRGARMHPLLQERSQLEQRFKGMGGEAAYQESVRPSVSQPSNLTYGGPGAGMSMTREEDDKKKNKEASELNRLLQEQLKLQTDLGLIGKDTLTQLEAKAELAKEILALTLKDIRATETGAIKDAKITNAILAYQKVVGETNEKWEETMKMLPEIDLQLAEIRNKIAGQGAIGQTPFQKALEDIEKQAIDNVQAIDKLLEKLNESFGTRAEAGNRRAQLGGLREQILGATPDQKAIAASRKATEEIVKDLNGQIAALQNAGKETRTIDEIILKIGEDWNNLSPQIKGDIEALASRIDELKPFAALQEQLKQLREEFKGLTDGSLILINSAKGIGEAFAQSFSATITGSMSAREALSQFFSNVGKMFADMAARMVAQWMVLKAIGIVQSLFPGLGAAPVASAPAAPSGPPLAMFAGAPAPPVVANANGNVLLGGFQAFANGGVVTGPTLGLVGEGRFNEAVVPLPDGRKIPVDLGGGAGNDISTNIVVNVNNGQAQSNVSGSGGNQLAKQLDAAVKEVILRETRPGGIIYSSR